MTLHESESVTLKHAGRLCSNVCLQVEVTWQSPERLLTVDFGGWRDEGTLRQHAETHTHVSTHTWIIGWYSPRLLQGNKTIQ